MISITAAKKIDYTYSKRFTKSRLKASIREEMGTDLLSDPASDESTQIYI